MRRNNRKYGMYGEKRKSKKYHMIFIIVLLLILFMGIAGILKEHKVDKKNASIETVFVDLEL